MVGFSMRAQEYPCKHSDKCNTTHNKSYRCDGSQQQLMIADVAEDQIHAYECGCNGETHQTKAGAKENKCFGRVFVNMSPKPVEVYVLFGFLHEEKDQQASQTG